ncbi:MAG: hypothetical protein H7235_11860 [Bdellovibrionaceae bacterium]|nr:hypothetical protein [Pseudobdellovibrionaceae bacterium]
MNFLDDKINSLNLKAIESDQCHNLGFELLSHNFGIKRFESVSVKHLFPEAFALNQSDVLLFVILLSRKSARLFEALKNYAIFGQGILHIENLKNKLLSTTDDSINFNLCLAAISSFTDDYEKADVFSKIKTSASSTTKFFTDFPVMSKSRISNSALKFGVLLPLTANRPSKFTSSLNKTKEAI